MLLLRGLCGPNPLQPAAAVGGTRNAGGFVLRPRVMRSESVAASAADGGARNAAGFVLADGSGNPAGRSPEQRGEDVAAQGTAWWQVACYGVQRLPAMCRLAASYIQIRVGRPRAAGDEPASVQGWSVHSPQPMFVPGDMEDGTGKFVP